jgi:hypothetical protein
MTKIFATTAVICPVGTTIELYQDKHPRVDETFDIRHIDTKKVVQQAKVKSVEDASYNGHKYYRILAEIIK